MGAAMKSSSLQCLSAEASDGALQVRADATKTREWHGCVQSSNGSLSKVATSMQCAWSEATDMQALQGSQAAALGRDFWGKNACMRVARSILSPGKGTTFTAQNLTETKCEDIQARRQLILRRLLMPTSQGFIFNTLSSIFVSWGFESQVLLANICDFASTQLYPLAKVLLN